MRTVEGWYFGIRLRRLVLIAREDEKVLIFKLLSEEWEITSVLQIAGEIEHMFCIDTAKQIVAKSLRVFRGITRYSLLFVSCVYFCLIRSTTRLSMVFSYPWVARYR